MKVGVYSIQGAIFEGEAEKLLAKTALGEIAVLNNHIPLLTTIYGPFLEIVDKRNERTRLKINSGILEVKPEGEMTVLVGDGYE